jgi:hypothetical protein
VNNSHLDRYINSLELLAPVEFARALKRVDQKEFLLALQQSDYLNSLSLSTVEGVLESAVVALSVHDYNLEDDVLMCILVSHLHVFSLSNTDMESCVTPLTVGLIAKRLKSVRALEFIGELLPRIMERVGRNRKVDPISIYPSLLAIFAEDETTTLSFRELALTWHESDVRYWEQTEVHPLLPAMAETSMIVGIRLLREAWSIAVDSGKYGVLGMEKIWDYFDKNTL